MRAIGAHLRAVGVKSARLPSKTGRTPITPGDFASVVWICDSGGVDAGSTRVRPKRTSVRVVTPSTSVRTRPPNFDRDSAREAWRQFARNRGANTGLGFEPRDGGPPWIALVGLGVALGLVMWFGWESMRSPSPSPSPAASPGAVATTTRGVAASTSKVPRARSSQGFTADVSDWTRRAPVKPALPSLAAASLHTDPAEREVAASHDVRRSRDPGSDATLDTASDGMDPDAAKAFVQVPRASSDLPPVSHVGRSGIHVDRIGMGTAYERGICDGEGATFSVRSSAQAHVCFRVVHRRTPETVTVRWERDGRLVKRTRVKIPADHAYRTRAGLGLRQAFTGHWVVRVVDDNGVELAATEFDVEH